MITHPGIITTTIEIRRSMLKHLDSAMLSLFASRLRCPDQSLKAQINQPEEITRTPIPLHVHFAKAQLMKGKIFGDR